MHKDAKNNIIRLIEKKKNEKANNREKIKKLEEEIKELNEELKKAEEKNKQKNEKLERIENKLSIKEINKKQRTENDDLNYDNLKLFLNKYWSIIRFKFIRSFLKLFKIKNKKQTVKSIWIRVFLDEEEFEMNKKDKFKKTITYVTNSFLIFNNTTFEDIYINAIFFWNLHKSLNLNDYKYLHKEDDIKVSMENSVKFQDKNTLESSKNIISIKNWPNEENNNQEEIKENKKFEIKKINKYENKELKLKNDETYILTDQNHNNLNVLNKIKISDFYQNEEFDYCILNLKKKNIYQKEWYESQVSSLNLDKDMQKKDKLNQLEIKKIISKTNNKIKGLKSYKSLNNLETTYYKKFEMITFVFSFLLFLLQTFNMLLFIPKNFYPVLNNIKNNLNMNSYKNVLNDTDIYSYLIQIYYFGQRDFFYKNIDLKIFFIYNGNLTNTSLVEGINLKNNPNKTFTPKLSYKASIYNLEIQKGLNLTNSFKGFNFNKYRIDNKWQDIIFQIVLYFPTYNQYLLNSSIFNISKEGIINFNLDAYAVSFKSLTTLIQDEKFTLDLILYLIIIFITVYKIINKKNESKSTKFFYLLEGIFLFFLTLISNLLFFNFYKSPNISLINYDNLYYIYTLKYYSKLIQIIIFIFNAYTTVFTLTFSKVSLYIINVIKTNIKWLWPLALFYIVLILALSFLLGNTYFNIENFYPPYNFFKVFQIIILFDRNYYNILLETLSDRVLFVIIIIQFLIFFILNNIFLGVQFEIIRVLDFKKEEEEKDNKKLT